MNLFSKKLMIALIAGAFAQIADVTDAPIHVEFTWCLNDCPQP